MNGDQPDIGIGSSPHWLSPNLKNIEKKLREIEERISSDLRWSEVKSVRSTHGVGIRLRTQRIKTKAKIQMFRSLKI